MTDAPPPRPPRRREKVLRANDISRPRKWWIRGDKAKFLYRTLKPQPVVSGPIGPYETAVPLARPTARSRPFGSYTLWPAAPSADPVTRDRDSCGNTCQQGRRANVGV